MGKLFKRSSKTKREKSGFPPRTKSNIPDKYDEILLAEEIEKLSIKLDENGKPRPFTEKEILSLCVRAVREKWMFCDNKLHFLAKNVILDKRPETRTLKVWKCNHCEKLFKGDEVNVDHIVSGFTTTSFEKFLEWSKHILEAGENDLQILCIPCHNLKSFMDLRGITDWSEGDKQYWVAKQLEKPSKTQKQYLTSNGFEEKDLKNPELREKAFLQLYDKISLTDFTF